MPAEIVSIQGGADSWNHELDDIEDEPVKEITFLKKKEKKNKIDKIHNPERIYDLLDNYSQGEKKEKKMKLSLIKDVYESDMKDFFLPIDNS